MLGFLTAAVSEAAFDANGVFNAGPGSSMELFSAYLFSGTTMLLMAALFSAVCVRSPGTGLRRGLGRKLLEPVMASLTSGGRSRGSTSGKNVDSAVDVAFDAVFTNALLSTMISPSEAVEN